jgi:glyoxylase-like metal-dependent hydrolase (beta-lactamase superfamily II)
LKTDGCSIFFAADICYTQEQLVEEKYSGTNASHKMAKDTYQKVRHLAKNNKLVFIPSHDAGASARLKDLELFVVIDAGDIFNFNFYRRWLSRSNHNEH